MREKPNRVDVIAYREEHECGMQEARDTLLRCWQHDCMREIASREFYTVEQCGDAIKELASLFSEILP